MSVDSFEGYISFRCNYRIIAQQHVVYVRWRGYLTLTLNFSCDLLSTRHKGFVSKSSKEVELKGLNIIKYALCAFWSSISEIDWRTWTRFNPSAAKRHLNQSLKTTMASLLLSPHENEQMNISVYEMDVSFSKRFYLFGVYQGIWTTPRVFNLLSSRANLHLSYNPAGRSHCRLQNHHAYIFTLIVPRAWEIGYTQPCIKCQGKSATHFVYFWSRKTLLYTHLEATSYIPQQGQSLHISTTSLATTGCYKNKYTIQFLCMECISWFATAILSGETELALGTIRVNVELYCVIQLKL